MYSPDEVMKMLLGYDLRKEKINNSKIEKRRIKQLTIAILAIMAGEKSIAGLESIQYGTIPDETENAIKEWRRLSKEYQDSLINDKTLRLSKGLDNDLD